MSNRSVERLPRKRKGEDEDLNGFNRAHKKAEQQKEDKRFKRAMSGLWDTSEEG